MESDFVALLADESPDAAIIMTAEGTVVHWNKGAEAIFGFTQSECLGRTVSELIVPENRADDERRFFEETLQGRYATFEFLRRRKDGSLVYVDVSSKVIDRPGQSAPLILCTKKDVTHLKIQRDAKLMEARYRDGIVKLAELDRTESRHARLGHAAAGTPAMLRHSINRRLKAAR